MYSLIFSTDVNSWLVTFGFHLHNSIPGFPVPISEMTQASYELAKSQVWDDLTVSLFWDEYLHILTYSH